MSTAIDYPVYFPYGATTAPYSPVRPHKGNDRCNVYGEPVVICGITVGGVGASGEVYDSAGNKGTKAAAHLHTQAGRDEWAQSTIDPTPYEFKAGTVVKTGWATQWGNFVCIKVGDVYTYYCHLSRIDVEVGQVIRQGDDGDMEATYETANIYSQELLFRDMSREEWEKYHKGKSRNQLFDDFRTSPERVARLKSLWQDNVDDETRELARQLYEKLK